MNRYLPRAWLALGFRGGLRFGRALRGYEPILRIVQLILLVWILTAGASLIAQALVATAKAIRSLFS